MNKAEFIKKYGEEKYKEHLRKAKESVRKAKTSDGDKKLCATALFEADYNSDDKLRSDELAYHFQRLIRFRWFKTHKEECIVIVEPKQTAGKKNCFKAELYVTNVNDDIEDWLLETIQELDFE